MNDHTSYIISNSPLYEYNTDNYLLRSEMEDMIELSLAKLPVKVREAFELHRFKGLTYKEIAIKQKVSVRTVEVRISKTLESLRKNFIDFL